MVQTKTSEALAQIFDKSPLTCAKIVDFEDESTLSLPPDFLEALKLETNCPHAILIIAREHKVIRIIPTKSNSIIKVSIEISELSPHFLEDLSRLLIQLNIKPLYSTGLVFTMENCFYEVFFDSSNLPIPTKDCIKAELQNVRSVSGVKITELAC